MGIVRMQDIGNALGVSTVTVSKALAGKEGVSESLRLKIKCKADEMGYVLPEKSAKTVSTNDIGVLIASGFVDSKDAFYWDMCEKVISRLQAANYYAILEIVKKSDEEQLTLPRFANRVCGLIAMGRLSAPYLRNLKENTKLPVLHLDDYNYENYNSSVVSNGYYGMYTVTNYLISMGHRNIMFVGTIWATSSISDRFFGFWRSMSEHGLPVALESCLADRGEDGIISFELPETLPTAFACNCDQTAFNLIRMLSDRGIRVPEDVSVTGFDNCVISDMCMPKITTYAVDTDGMAFACVNNLIRLLGGLSTDHMSVVDGRLLIKDSVARCQSAPPDVRASEKMR
ncbi:MAG: LacI family DNA-binding transcriptional regulator [Clostridiales bacterium]|jgi:DNA-binding LacI/PurR family transcriptional regulator|nr:LacI family DNA-binding transcriptional regulator [Clostridiales bacterium]